jgi:hypothetical protein
MARGKIGAVGAPAWAQTLDSVRTQDVPRYKFPADPDAEDPLYRRLLDLDSITADDRCMVVFRMRRSTPCR